MAMTLPGLVQKPRMPHVRRQEQKHQILKLHLAESRRGSANVLRVRTKTTLQTTNATVRSHKSGPSVHRRAMGGSLLAIIASMILTDIPSAIRPRLIIVTAQVFLLRNCIG